MAPFFANCSCDPFQAGLLPCVVGTYVQYAIDVATAEHVQAGIKFAFEHNIRLVVRNTGHDYNGKSTGAGALGLWMHHLKDIEVVDWDDTHYSGKALKMGAGVEGLEAYKVADKAGLHVVGGTCPSIGISGGYSQGGGHSPLASLHGLAADQILEIEVITSEGEHLIVNRHQNQDLHWAMSGGGAGTFAVTLSMKYKAHPDNAFSSMTLNYDASYVANNTHYEVINWFHSFLPELTDQGITVVWYFTAAYLAVLPVTAPNMNSTELRKTMKPLESKLDTLNINFTSEYTDFDRFFTYYQGTTDPDQPIDVGIAQYGGRLIPRSILTDDATNQDLTNALQFVNTQGVQFIGVALNVSSKVAGDVANAVLPAWRHSTIVGVVTTPWSFQKPWSEMVAQADLMTRTLLPAIDEVVGNPQAYLNEGDFQEPNWQSVFYGENYDKLLSIKNKYDPSHLLYAKPAVGAEYYVEGEDHRLCRSS
ncbi:FAD binding domain protein [Hortaea werneckii]|nr:FAD binding domain protein [Hortaea werneckii]